MINTRSASEKLASEGIKLTPEQIAQLAKQGLFSGAQKDDGERWQIPESAIEQFILYKKKRKRITLGAIVSTVISIVAILGIISIADDLINLTNRLFFNKANPSANSYIKIVSITPDRGLELSKTDLEKGIPIEIKVEYRNSLPSGFKQGEVIPFISLSTLMSINDDEGASHWRELAKEQGVFFGTGEATIKGLLTKDYIRDDKITLSIALRFTVENSTRNYTSSDGNLIIEYQIKK